MGWGSTEVTWELWSTVPKGCFSQIEIYKALEGATVEIGHDGLRGWGDFLIMLAGQSGNKKSIWLKLMGWLHNLPYLEQKIYYRFLAVGSWVWWLDIMCFWSNAALPGTRKLYLSFSLLTWQPGEEQLHLELRHFFQQLSFVFLSSTSLL